MILGIIPARYASSRFPGKPLCNIKGKTMLQRVYEKASESKLLDAIIVATDDDRILKHAESIGAKAVMTSIEHPSGTDRCYEALLLSGLKADYVINIQGDEPFLDPEQINELARACDSSTELITQTTVCKDHSVLFDKGEVKIVLNGNNEAIYFSRQVIPALKGKPESEWHLLHTYYRHVGMYAYRSDVLKAITQLQPSPLELAESLEQLRWLEAGYKIKCVPTSFDSHCIDTPEDIEKVVTLMGLNNL
jgi:3-deoxy-manno-octulosonate cytidylyltransferase (CMP-KDO synthetase)